MAGLDLSGLVPMVEGMILLDTLRFSRPGTGQPVFNDATGEYDYPVAQTVYEGPGAVQAAGGALGGVSVVPLPNLPWTDETRSPYRALTPLSAPVAERDMIVSVVAVHPGGDAALIGRQWRAQDPGGAGTLGVVRITALDQMQQNQDGA
ncbi:DUF6093 family protein [Streptomyces sp. NPDC055105]|uniref:DUF6093 family protein n=1 Tax=Streptomyces sp. NPDC055105 TaxID=3365719 RepID=UPI0037CCF056